MFKRASSLLGIALLPVVLAGCGVFGGEGMQLRANLNPTQIGFEVDDDGAITIVSNNVSFRNPANAAAATVVGYEVRIVDSDGDDLFGTESELYNYHLAIEVPAGYVCADAETQQCDIGQRTVQATYSEPVSFVMLHGPAAMALVLSGEARYVAEVTFEAIQSGRTVVWTEAVTITYPVGLE